MIYGPEDNNDPLDNVADVCGTILKWLLIISGVFLAGHYIVSILKNAGIL